MLEGLGGMLAFFATVLVLVTGGIVIFAALIARQPRRAGRAGLVLLGWITLYIIILLGFSLTSQPRYLAAGEERCFDEMCYSLQAVSITHSLGALNAQGNFYVVTIQLRSSAKRTAQQPSQPGLLVVDAQGRRYDHFVGAGNEPGAAPGQPLSAALLWDRQIQPGETVQKTVAFDLPIGVSRPGLVVEEGIGPLSTIIIGDEGSLLHAKTEFLLQP